ncbi:MAG: hypothetical protein OXI88_01315 [Gammaproteobacteria bacterium]|nr:hypothetical protein [Gammaproteobacteria bacterium]
MDVTKPAAVLLCYNDNMEKRERRELYEKTRKDLLDREHSNSRLYDRAILTLSTTFLGLSLAFINDVNPLNEAQYSALLIVSWSLFGAAIISTILSFWTSQKGLKIQVNYAEKYYLEEKDEYRKTSIYAKITDYLNYCSGLLFIAAVVSTIVFVSINI